MELIIPPTVTDRAFKKIEESCESKILRIAVKGGGCSGFQYVFSVVDKINKTIRSSQKEIAESL